MKRNTEKALGSLIVATGISSVVSQLLIIREYLTQFQGNEYVIALIFFAWLILGGLGSFATSFGVPGNFKPLPARLVLLSLLAAALPTIELMTIRLFRDVVFTQGASTGFYKTLFFVFATLGPYGFLIGFLLPYSLTVLRDRVPGYPGTRAYLLDNIGDFTGGALFSFVLIYLFSPLQAAMLSGLILVLAALALAGTTRGITFKTVAAVLAVLGVLTVGLLKEEASLAPQNGRLVWYQESRYGRITVVEHQAQFTIFADGVPLTQSHDVAAAEAAIHYPLSQAAAPGNILIISARGGMLQEVAKYHPGTVDYLELNPAVAEAQFRFNLLKQIRGLKVVHQDARAFLANTEKKYAVAIINTPDPETFQTNRFYTGEFYRLVKRHLTPGGVLGFSVSGYANYLSESKAGILSSLYQTVRKSFKNVVVLPGERVFFICSDGPVDVDIPAQLARKEIQTDYVDGYYYGNVTPRRIAGLRQQLLPGAPLNEDANPYLMRLMFTRWFEKFATSPRWLYMALAVVFGFYVVRMSRAEYLLLSTGFMTMGSEITIIFAFQAFFGYIYSQISLIVTVFLAGLLPGALLGQKLKRDARKFQLLSDGLLICLCVLLGLMILPAQSQPAAWLLLLLGFCVSVLCGCQFPLALESGGEDNRRMSYAFSADLAGAAWGALLTSVLLIPYLGLGGTLLALIGLKLSSMLVTASGNKTDKFEVT